MEEIDRHKDDPDRIIYEAKSSVGGGACEALRDL